jgi:hypothetical protein
MDDKTKIPIFDGEKKSTRPVNVHRNVGHVSEDRTQKQSQTPGVFVSFIAVNKNHAMVTKVEENKIFYPWLPKLLRTSKIQNKVNITLMWGITFWKNVFKRENYPLNMLKLETMLLTSWQKLWEKFYIYKKNSLLLNMFILDILCYKVMK